MNANDYSLPMPRLEEFGLLSKHHSSTFLERPFFRSKTLSTLCMVSEPAVNPTQPFFLLRLTKASLLVVADARLRAGRRGIRSDVVRSGRRFTPSIRRRPVVRP
jgi:hypothetical protein